jgi:hypothetical protein
VRFGVPEVTADTKTKFSAIKFGVPAAKCNEFAH